MECISIIICSRKQTINSDLSENIKTTIGFNYELIIIDNSTNQYSIFEAYNIGIKKSIGELLVFLHDDIIIHTQDWGLILNNIFESDSKIGLIGVAGGKVKTKMPSAWWDGGNNVLNIIQHYKNKPKELWNHGFSIADFEEVATIDGVFMAMKRNERINFDERLKGYHNYDLFLSLYHHRLNKKVVVTNQILLEHLSEGNLSLEWYNSTSFFHKQYKNLLPIVLADENKNEHFKNKEFNIGDKFVTKLIELKLYSHAIYWWFEMFKLKPISKYHIRFWKKIIK